MIFIQQTHTFLDQIIEKKLIRLQLQRHSQPVEVLRERYERAAGLDKLPPIPTFSTGLRRPKSLGVIAEIKKASPSKGLIALDFHPDQQALAYESAGVQAISVLTEEDYFLGSCDDLLQVRATVNLPILRKDFIIEAGQIYEARLMGASAILLICTVLDDRALEDFLSLTHDLGMEALVEVHNLNELMRALSAGATLIGINNRDLRSFHVDISVTERLAGLIPAGRTIVAESGLLEARDVARAYRAGAHAVLIGEALMRASGTPESVQDRLQSLFEELPSCSKER